VDAIIPANIPRTTLPRLKEILPEIITLSLCAVGVLAWLEFGYDDSACLDL
jgi:hypothetical protein